MQTINILALSGIRTHDHSTRASEDSSCVRLLGYRDRPILILFCLISEMFQMALCAYDFDKSSLCTLVSPTRATCLVHLMTIILLGEEYTPQTLQS
jgi:hypothetical protein